MASLSLAAEARNTEEKTAQIRKNKKIPAVVYGKNTESTSITIDYSEFLKTFRQSWESTIITLNIGKESHDVLVNNIQKAPVTGDYTHIDFYAITRGEALTAHIHFNFIGESLGAREGGILEELMKDVEVKCLPRDLVDHFDVDLSKLEEIWSMIKLWDLGIDTEKYELWHDLEEVVAKISIPRVEEEEPVNLDDVAVTGADEDPDAAEGEEGNEGGTEEK